MHAYLVCYMNWWNSSRITKGSIIGYLEGKRDMQELYLETESDTEVKVANLKYQNIQKQ